jgi:riboflavin transporter FmnP
MNRKSKTNLLIKTSLMGVIAFIIMFIEAPIPFFPSFLKIDLSDIPALIVAFSLGPVYGIGVELVKNLLHLLRTTTGGIGELANFIVGISFIVPASLIYIKNKTKKSAVFGMIIGTIIMAAVGGIANYYILIPFYSTFMPIEAIVALGSEVNKLIVDVNSLILYAIVPFNLFKGIVLSLITIPIYKKIAVILHK